jgi:ectoine hydroxylase-related dioxygenase (phytanoyl-CoA dioxygenase family)
MSFVTDAHRQAYARDGIAKVEGVFDRAWVETLTHAFDRLIARVEQGQDLGPRLFANSSNGDGDVQPASGRAHLRFAIGHDADLWRWVTDSPVGQLVGDMIGARTVQFWQDTWFSKKAAGQDSATVWHHDAPGLFSGEHYPVTWVALTDVGPNDAPLITFRGSHRDERLFVPPYRPGKEHLPLAEGFYETSVMEKEVAAAPDRIQVWTMKAGDVLVMHPVTWHASLSSKPGGAPRRLALTVRWLGNDVEYRPNPYSMGAGHFPELDKVPIGTKPPFDFLPVIWRRPDLAA